MTKTRVYKISLFVAVILMCTCFTAALFKFGYMEGGVGAAQDVPEENGNSLASFVVSTDDDPIAGGEQTLNEEGILNERGRLTQRVTIYDESGTLPISGTVTKSQDAFYPGTYELTFSRNAILNDKATVQVKMDVEEGQPVYILTGNKEKGYREVAVTTADSNKCVSFETQLLQNYTLSTTDISGAQEAMARHRES
ncbi:MULTISPECIES: hypothetical protein [unclassified Butyrivibrio]|uniref:hypothetical protein n=1 Tax=unclassified Butyrivibrio TaxID=2639466 RepID=UPI0003B51AFD|nr:MULTISPECIES: hypothetical protein [unclassified Butyrivibrio]MDC7294793.1 hypothetical protein [Butyrivibrio sp. DSM 10294]